MSWLAARLGAAADKIIVGLIAGIGFLFAFYVDNTYMTRAAFAEEQSAVMKELRAISKQISDAAAEDKRNLEIDGLQDSIADAEDEMMELDIYIQQAPQSSLTQARRMRFQALQIRKNRLERELEQALDEPQ